MKIIFIVYLLRSSEVKVESDIKAAITSFVFTHTES